MAIYDFKDIKKKVKKQLTPIRYQHTLAVAYTACALAMKHDADIEKAYIAGLLHDCAKCIPDDILLARCTKYNIMISDAERKLPDLLHAKLGAYYAKERYSIQNDDILNAITYHTTGRPNMSILEKIIFVADYIEPNRKELPELKSIQKISFEDIDLALYNILKSTLEYLEQDMFHQKKIRPKEHIDQTTQEAFEYYKYITQKEAQENKNVKE